MTLKLHHQKMYENIYKGARFSSVYISTLLLSIVVAVVGLYNNNVSVIIGAMVIAPMFGPSIAMGLGSVLGDLSLLKRAFLTGLIGIIITIGISIFIGLFLVIDPTSSELALRTRVGIGDVLVGLASGCAGAVSLSTGEQTTLIGVMLAVSLMPPLVTFGLLIGGGHPISFAWNALLLFLVNLICINFASTITFLTQGIHAYSFWNGEDVKRGLKVSIIMMICIVLSLALLFGVNPNKF